MNGFYTRYFACQVENTLSFALILRADFGRTVEIFFTNLWITLWKTSQVCSSHNLKIQVILTKPDPSCGKLSKSSAKKSFQIEKKLILRLSSSDFSSNFVRNVNYLRNVSPHGSNFQLNFMIFRDKKSAKSGNVLILWC